MYLFCRQLFLANLVPFEASLADIALNSWNRDHYPGRFGGLGVVDTIGRRNVRHLGDLSPLQSSAQSDRVMAESTFYCWQGHRRKVF